MIPIPATLTEGTDNYRLFIALRSGEPKSHHELYALHMIVHSRASDLRLKHGCLIDTWRDGGTTYYQLRSVLGEADGMSPAGPSSASQNRTVQRGEVAADGDSAHSASPFGPSWADGSSPDPQFGGLDAGRSGAPSLSPEEHPTQLTVWEAA